MAESAVKSAANWLGKLLVEEGKYLWGVEDKVAGLRNELIWMQGFLRDADSLQYDDEIVAQWVLQIKEYVSMAEDIVDKFVIEVASRRRQSGWTNQLERWSCIGMELFALHQVGSHIDSLKLKISALTPKLQTYGLKTAYGMKTYRTREVLSEQAQQRMSYVHLESKNIVGLEKDTEMVVDALLNGKSKVVAIYGMGGLGKTTLATKVYSHDKIKNHFNGGFAWAYISKQFQVQSVLQKLIADLTSKSTDMIAGRANDALIHELYEFIGKNKCLVVLDDVWETLVWDCLKAAFLREGVGSGSRILLTTRKEDVAKHVYSKALPKPDPLNEKESWELLEFTLGWKEGNNGKKEVVENTGLENSQGKELRASDASSSRQAAEMLENDGIHPNLSGKEGNNGKKEVVENTGLENSKGKDLQESDASSSRHGAEMFGTDGSEVTELGKKMVKHCDGIPLAIVVLGGILRKKESLNEWRLVSENITSYLRRGYDHGRSFMEVLVLSYNDLSFHLKPCFLHLGNFPEDYEIRTEKLYRMWVAEGLVMWPHDRVSSTESLEDIANSYLIDLAQAGMVQVMNKGSDGRIKSIRVHDLMRDVCLQKATMENFLSIIDHRPCPNEPLSHSSSLIHTRLLRMAIYLAKGVNKYLPDFLTSKAHEYLRSLLLFAGQEVHGECEHWMKCICNDFPWLWVLDVEGLPLKGKLSGDIKKMIRLRYLNLKGTQFSEVPSSIGDMRFLQTLDLRVSFAGSIKIPNTLWKLERLRHLFLPKKSYEIKKSEFLKLDSLSSLETLKNVEVGRFRVEDLLKLRKLKKLSIKGVVSKVESMKNIVESPAAKSGCLRSCSLVVEGSIIDGKPSLLSSFNCLHRLDVSGKICFLEENVLPQSLEVLHLEYSALEKDPMKILGGLHHLKDLLLGHSSYVGTEMICQPDSFPQLTMLNLQWLAKLELWTLHQRSMSGLKNLTIMDCSKLKLIPVGLPSTVRITCSPCIDGIKRYGTCSYHGATFGVDNPDNDILFDRDDDTKNLVNLLVNGDSKKVVLMGPAAVGKATLTKVLYHQPEIRRKFDAIAWARCPYKQIPTCLVQGLLRQLDPAKSRKDPSEHYSDVTAQLKAVLMEKKCLVILTDLQVSLEDLDGTIGSHLEKGSKLLVTSFDRLPNKPDILSQKSLYKLESLDFKKKLGGALSDSDTHHLKQLSVDQSSKLFKGRLQVTLKGSEGDEKIEVGQSMLEHCSGQPLSIIMLAGLLAMKKSLIEWQNIQKEVTLRKKTSQGPQLIHALSYDDLSPHLKHCFLYLANFPEGTEISTSRVYGMWIATGLVRLKDDGDLSKKRKDDEIEAVKLETVAEGYLDELVLRGMVQVGKRGPSRKICTFWLPNVLRILCLKKAREEKFDNVVCQTESVTEHQKQSGPANIISTGFSHRFKNKGRKEDVNTTSQLEPSASTSNEKIVANNLAVPLSEGGQGIFHNSTFLSVKDLRSLLLFTQVRDINSSYYNWDWFTKLHYHHFGSLCVLDLEGMGMIEGALPEEVGKLILLRYLSLKGTSVYELSKSFDQLTNLQTLDLRVKKLISVPDVLFNFQNMRHLYLPDSFSVKNTLKLQLDRLKQLQTLANLHTDKVVLNHLLELKYLKKMVIKNIHPESDLNDILKSFSSMDLCINNEVFSSNSNILASFHNLNKMTIKGRMTGCLHDGMFPKSLKELKLKHTLLEDDPIPALRQLPELTHLFLDHESFIGKKMIFSLGFPRLTHLTVRLLSNLEELDMTSADHLRHIVPVILDCWRLEVKRPTAEIELGMLGHHPLMELLKPVQLQDY